MKATLATILAVLLCLPAEAGRWWVNASRNADGSVFGCHLNYHDGVFDVEINTSTMRRNASLGIPAMQPSLQYRYNHLEEGAHWRSQPVDEARPQWLCVRDSDGEQNCDLRRDAATEYLVTYRIGLSSTAETRDAWLRPDAIIEHCRYEDDTAGAECVVHQRTHDWPWWDGAPVHEIFGSDDPVAVRFDIPGKASIMADGYTFHDGRDAFRTLVECGNTILPEKLPTAEEAAQATLERALEQAASVPQRFPR